MNFSHENKIDSLKIGDAQGGN